MSLNSKKTIITGYQYTYISQKDKSQEKKISTYIFLDVFPKKSLDLI